MNTSTSIKSLQAMAKKAGDAHGRLMKEIPLEKINPDAAQPRKHFDAESLKNLGASLKANGQIYPLVVHATGGDGYGIIDGERRWRAMRAAGIKEASCIVLPKENDDGLAVKQLILNIARDEISPAEQASFVYQMKNKLGLRANEIADRLQKSKGEVSKMLTVGACLSRGGAAANKIQGLINAGRLVGLSTIYAAVTRLRDAGKDDKNLAAAKGARLTRKMLSVSPPADGRAKKKGAPQIAIAVGVELECNGRTWKVKSIARKQKGLLISAE